MAPASCDACGKSGGRLLRCGRCRGVWFCNRECQVRAARQGHSGANCRPANGPRAANAEVAPRVPDHAGPNTTALGVDSLAPAANACYACGKSDVKLLLCGRCRDAWFCNRECQVVARKELGHRGANCRPSDSVQRPHSSTNARSPGAAPSQPSTAFDMLQQRFNDLVKEAHQAYIANTRLGYLAAVAKFKEAASVADLIGGVRGAMCRVHADTRQSDCLVRLGNMAAAARVACSSLRVARAAGRRPSLLQALVACGTVAQKAPDEMLKAERESREQERRCGSFPSYGDLDLSQEGRISLPTTPAGLSRVELAYKEAAVATCDAALAAAGGRDSPASNDDERVPPLDMEAEARGALGGFLYHLGERQRGWELLRQALALLRQVLQRAAPGYDALQAKLTLANLLCNLGMVLNSSGARDSGDAPGSDGMAEAEVYLREALEISEETDNVFLKQHVLLNFANMSGRPDQPVGPAEAAAFRSRLNALYARAGRNHDTSCTICLEPLEQPDDGAGQGGVGDGVTPDGYTNSAVYVLPCAHQFHRGCLSGWWCTRSDFKCPLCKE